MVSRNPEIPEDDFSHALLNRYFNSTFGPYDLSEVVLVENRNSQPNLLVSPTGLGIRNDKGGKGYFGAKRSEKLHKGLDFKSVDGQYVVSPINGRVKNFYGYKSGYPMVQIYPSNSEIGFDYIEILYVSALDRTQLGVFRNVSAGDIIGTSVNLQSLDYPDKVGPHVHLQMWLQEKRINPTNFFFRK